MTRLPSLTTGTLLATIPRVSTDGEHILELDFAKGSVTRLTGQLAAQGVDQAALLAIGLDAQGALQSPKGLPADLWSGRCMAEAVVTYPNAIGFPYDILATEKDSLGSWIAHTVRYAAPPTVANPLFLLP